MKIVRYFILTAIAVLAVYPNQCYPKVYIDINAPAGKRLPVAIPDIMPMKDMNELADVGATLREVIINDLGLTGLFDIIDKKAYVEDPVKLGKRYGEVEYRDWRLIGADALIKGAFIQDGEDLTVELKLFDVVEAKMLVGRRYIGRKANIRGIAHKFSNEIMEALTGERGIFDTKLLFVSGASAGKEIFLSDYDGYNVKQITKNSSINLSPQWSPDGKQILYTSYKEGQPYLYMLELSTGRDLRLSGEPGLNIGARWSPSGNEVALTLSRDGNPELYLLKLDGTKLKRLTSNWAIDVSPSWSPDGKKLAFVSDMGGNPHIYVISSDGTEFSRLTFEGKYNASPAWSPRGDKIAFSRMDSGRFDIWVMNADGSNQVQLTAGNGSNENPSWSPDGRYIVFSSTRKGVSSIYIMHNNGGNLREVKMQDLEKKPQTLPAWSPYLK